MGPVPVLAVPVNVNKCRVIQGQRRRPSSPRILRLTARTRTPSSTGSAASSSSSISLAGSSIPDAVSLKPSDDSHSPTGPAAAFLDDNGHSKHDVPKDSLELYAEAQRLQNVLKERSIGKMVAARSAAVAEEYTSNVMLGKYGLSKLQRQLASCRRALELEREENIQLLRETACLRQAAKAEAAKLAELDGDLADAAGPKALDREFMQLESMLQTAVDWEYDRKDQALSKAENKLAALAKSLAPLTGSDSEQGSEDDLKSSSFSKGDSPRKGLEVFGMVQSLASQAVHHVQTEARNIAQKLNVDLRALHGKVESTQDTTDALKPPVREMRSITDALKSELNELKNQLRLERAENVELRAQLSALRDQIEDVGTVKKESEVNTAEYQRAALLLKKRVGSLEKTITATSKSLQEAREDKSSQLQMYVAQIATLQKEKAETEERVAALEAKLTRAEEVLGVERQRNHELSSAAAHLEGKVVKLELTSKEAAEALEAEREARAQQVASLQARVNALEKEKAQLERFERRAREVSERLEAEQAKIETMTANATAATSKAAALEKTYAVAAKSLQDAREDRERQMRYLVDQIAELHQRDEQITALNADLSVAQEAQATAQAELAAVRQALATERAKAAALARASEELSARVASLERHSAAAAKSLLESRKEKSVHLAEAAERTVQLTALEAERASLAASLDSAKAMYAQERIRAQELARENSVLTKQVGGLKETAAATTRSLIEARRDKQAQLAALAQQVTRLQKFEKVASELAGKLEEATRHLGEERQRNTVLSHGAEELSKKVSALEVAYNEATRTMSDTRKEKQREVADLARRLAAAQSDSEEMARWESRAVQLAEELTTEQAKSAGLAHEMEALVKQLATVSDQRDTAAAEAERLRGADERARDATSQLIQTTRLYKAELERSQALAEENLALAARVSGLEQAAAAAAAALTAARKEKQEAVAELSKELTQLRRFEKQAETLAANLQVASDKLAEQVHKNAALSVDKERLSSEVSDLRRANAEAAREAAQVQAALRDQFEAAQAQTEQLAQQLRASTAQVSELSRGKLAATASAGTLAAQVEALKRANSAAAKALVETRKDKAAALAVASKQVATLARYEQEAVRLANSLKSAQAQLAAEAQQKDSLAGQVQSLKAQGAAAVARVAALEGYEREAQALYVRLTEANELLDHEKSASGALQHQYKELTRKFTETALSNEELKSAYSAAGAALAQARREKAEQLGAVSSEVSRLRTFETAAAMLAAKLDRASSELGGERARSGSLAREKAEMSRLLKRYHAGQEAAQRALKQARLDKAHALSHANARVAKLEKCEAVAENLAERLEDVAVKYEKERSRTAVLTRAAAQLQARVASLDNGQRNAQRALAEARKDKAAVVALSSSVDKGKLAAYEQRALTLAAVLEESRRMLIEEQGKTGTLSRAAAEASRKMAHLERAEEAARRALQEARKDKHQSLRALVDMVAKVNRLEHTQAPSTPPAVPPPAAAPARQIRDSSSSVELKGVKPVHAARAADSAQLRALTQRSGSKMAVFQKRAEELALSLDTNQDKSKKLQQLAADLTRQLAAAQGDHTALLRSLSGMRQVKQQQLQGLEAQVATIQHGEQVAAQAAKKLDEAIAKMGSKGITAETDANAALRQSALAAAEQLRAAREAKAAQLAALTSRASSLQADTQALARFEEAAGQLSNSLEEESGKAAQFQRATQQFTEQVASLKDVHTRVSRQLEEKDVAVGDTATAAPPLLALAEKYSGLHAVQSQTSQLSSQLTELAAQLKEELTHSCELVQSSAELCEELGRLDTEAPSAQLSALVQTVTRLQKVEKAVTILAAGAPLSQDAMPPTSPEKLAAEAEIEAEVEAVDGEVEQNWPELSWAAAQAAAHPSLDTTAVLEERRAMQDEMIMLSADLTEAKSQIASLRGAEERAVLRYVKADRRNSEAMAGAMKKLIGKLKEAESAALMTSQKLTSKLVLTQRQLLKLEEVVQERRALSQQ